MTTITEDRKQWHGLASSVGSCKSCGGPLEEIMFSNEIIGVEYDYVCKNPDCPEKQ
jgi:hypothetical protein